MEVQLMEITQDEQWLSRLEEYVVGQGVEEKIAFLADIVWPYLQYNRAFVLVKGEHLVGGMVLAQNFASPIWLLAADQVEHLTALYLEAKGKEPGGAFFLTAREYQLMEGELALEVEEVVLQMQRDSSVPLPEIAEELVLEEVEAAELDQLDAFYQIHYYHAWHRDSFHLGPIYWIKRQGEIIAVASCQSKYQGQIMIGNIFVLPEERGQGLGQAIVVQLISALEAKGAKVGLFVDEVNVNAIGLYRKLGFRVFQKRIFV